MKRTFTTILAALAVLVFAGCKSNKVEPTEKLVLTGFSGNWILSSFTEASVEDMSSINLGISYDTESKGYVFNGFSGVNHFFANVENKEPVFPLGANVASTKMMGAPEEMAFEDAFLELMCKADSWTVERNTLTVTDGSKTAVFKFDDRNEK